MALSSPQEIQSALAARRLLDECIQDEAWWASLFLQGIRKKLEELRDQFEQNVGLDQIDLIQSSGLHVEADPSVHTREVYVSLYQSQGNNLHRWSEVIGSLTSHLMGRPVYGTEEDVKAAMQLKDNNLNNAYVIVKVDADAILSDSAGQPRCDKDGRELLVLREGSVELSNVVCFMHGTGQYKFVSGFLVKQASEQQAKA